MLRVLITSDESISVGRWIDFMEDDAMQKVHEVIIDSMNYCGSKSLTNRQSDSEIPFKYLENLDPEELYALGKAMRDVWRSDEEIGAFCAFSEFYSVYDSIDYVNAGIYKYYGVSTSDLGIRRLKETPLYKALSDADACRFFDFKKYGELEESKLDLVYTHFGMYVLNTKFEED